MHSNMFLYKTEFALTLHRFSPLFIAAQESVNQGLCPGLHYKQKAYTQHMGRFPADKDAAGTERAGRTSGVQMFIREFSFYSESVCNVISHFIKKGTFWLRELLNNSAVEGQKPSR